MAQKVNAPSAKTETKSTQIEAPQQVEKPVPLQPVPTPIKIQPVAPVKATAPSTTPSDAKLFIYLKESGNNPARYNSSGCLGLGQACPASKLLAVCPDINDYACQDAWFTNYATKRYGGWEQAKAFWLAHNWW